jgi:Asp-tRNA(Asn)/Glu-tRNA(Gln) amidotransferase A subunit family amidase
MSKTIGKLAGPLLVAAALAATGGQAAGRGPRAILDEQSAPPFDVVEKTIFELQDAMRDRLVTARQLVEQYLARIRAYDQDGPRLNAFVAVNPRALEIADALDAERRSGKVRGVLHGIPIAVKDNYATVDMPTTGGSLALEGFQTERDAFMVKKLRDAGAVIIGKTTLHELAYGITTVASISGQTRNPYDPLRNPGGSSGGTGAAVAANLAAAGLGSDTCGSIRNPSAQNNLFGLRGTAGLSSRDGIIPLSHTQDIGGPLARTVTDLAVMLDATVGADPADPATRASEGRIPASYVTQMGDSSLRGVRLGVLTALFGTAPEDKEVAGIVYAAIEKLQHIGIDTVAITIPGYDEMMQNTSVINAEFKFDLMDFLARYPKAPVKSLDEILSRGLYHAAVDGVLRRANEVASRDSESYRASLAKRDAARKTVLAAMREQKIHALAYPTLRRKPALIGEGQGGSNCQLSATTGLPAMSMPAGFTADGLPVGLELLGGAFSEPLLLRVAYAYEREVRPRRPPELRQ